MTAETFEKDGRTIPFQRAWLTREARAASPAGLEFTLPGEVDTRAGSTPRQGKGKKRKEGRSLAVAADPDLAAGLKA